MNPNNGFHLLECNKKQLQSFSTRQIGERVWLQLSLKPQIKKCLEMYLRLAVFIFENLLFMSLFVFEPAISVSDFTWVLSFEDVYLDQLSLLSLLVPGCCGLCCHLHLSRACQGDEITAWYGAWLAEKTDPWTVWGWMSLLCQCFSCQHSKRWKSCASCSFAND